MNITLSQPWLERHTRPWTPSVVVLKKSRPRSRLSRSLSKATISTPMKDGSVDYDSVPIGATIWVTVTKETSPLHGRPIKITKRPDHSFALTGGSGAKHIQGRRHMVMNTGRVKASEVDEAALAERKEVEKRNAPKKAALKEKRRKERKIRKDAENRFMEAVGIKKRGLSQEDRQIVQNTAVAHGEAMGMDEKQAKQYGRNIARGIARKERERKKKKVAAAFDRAKLLNLGLTPEQAHAEAGPEVAPFQVRLPDENDIPGLSEMAPAEQENEIQNWLDDQEAKADQEAREDSRFEENDVPDDGAPFVPAEAEVETTPTTTGGPDTVGSTEDEVESESDPDADPASWAKEHAPDGAPEDQEGDPGDTSSPPMITIGGEDGPIQDGAAEDDAGEDAEPEPETRPIMSHEAAEEAVERFRELVVARRDSKEIAATLEALPEAENASPTALEALKIEARSLTDEELENFAIDFREQAMSAGSDGAFYQAIMPHWNEHIGNKLNGAVTNGASTAIAGLIGDELAVRYDVKKLIDALGPEAASVAVVQRMRSEMSDRDFAQWVSKLGSDNVKGQRDTEKKALARHAELQNQADDLERQVEKGDLQSEITIEMLRARNLMEQRENLGGALGSMQVSASMYHFGEMALGEGWRKHHPVVIKVASKIALEDKLARLGRFKKKVRYNLQTGMHEIHTDSQALRKFVTRTEADRADNAKWDSVKRNTDGIAKDAEGREWVHDYKVHGFRDTFPDASMLPSDLKHMAGKKISLMADQRNNTEWLHGSGGGLLTMRTGGGKTLVSVGVAGKMLKDNPKGRHLRIVPDGRQAQWKAEIESFTNIPVVVLPAKSTKAERHAILAAAPEGSTVIVGHTHAGRYDHAALAEAHEWDSVGIDEPQELRSKSGSGKMSAGAKRIFKIPAKNRHALTATPATEHPVEAYDIVNWARPGVLGYRTRFERAFSGFGGGTNAQDAAIQRMMYDELKPHMSADRQVAPHYNIEHTDNPVKMSKPQLRAQKRIEARVGAHVQATIDQFYDKKRAGVRGYAETSFGALRKKATEKAMAQMEKEHRANLGGGDVSHNPKLSTLQKKIQGAKKDERHVIFVDSADQRRSVTAMLHGMGVDRANVRNITQSAKGATVKRDGKPVAAIEERKRAWKGTKGGYLLIDRTSASGHNLAEGDHLHVLGNPDDAAQMLQAHGRLGRSNRVGDFKIHTYRYGDSPFEHHHWNGLHRQLKVLKATAPGMFVEGAKKMAKGRRLVFVKAAPARPTREARPLRRVGTFWFRG